MNNIKDRPAPADVSPDGVFKVVVIGASAGESRLSIISSQHCHPNSEPLSPWSSTGTQRSGVCWPTSLAAPAHFRSWMLRVVNRFALVSFSSPPDRHLAVAPEGTLSLDQSERCHFARPSLDKLFISAAENFKSRVIAVVLSGIGSDGKLGVRTVKRMGGMVIAQDEETSEHFGMPQAAIRTGVVDYVLPLAYIGAALVGLVIDSGSMTHG